MSIPVSLPDVLNLAASLAAGLLIGLERGWNKRALSEGSRVAGLRTFALSGLLGGLLVSLPGSVGVWAFVGGIIGMAVLVAVAYRAEAKATGDLSVTTAVAMLVTLVLGAIAASGAVALALAAAVVVAVLLDLKPTLHGWLRMIEHRELTAALQLLVLSVVILPNLPNVGFGPYNALNPYQLWWAVVLIAGLSLAGHIAMRATGPDRGILWTGLLGGLASSTATTLALARYARQHPPLSEVAAAATLAACGVMYFRMVVLLVVIAPALLKTFGFSLAIAGVVLLTLGVWRWRQLSTITSNASQMEPMAAFDLGTALGFGAFLAVMAVLVPAAKEWFGSGGMYVLSALSGLADVDAILISLARVHDTDSAQMATTVIALGLATIANMVTKGLIALSAGGRKFGAVVLYGYGVAIFFGTLAVIAAMYS